jgi:Flp pilus assembly protein TadB
MAAIVCAVGSALGWWVITRNPVTGALMAIIGWQLPGFVAELRAAGALTTQVRQISTFIGTFADSLETDHTVGQAVDDGARAVTGPPLQAEAELVIRRIHGGSSVTDALRAMGETVKLPLWDLYVDLVGLNQDMGASSGLFRDLDWQLQEEDRVQVEFRTLIGAYMAIIVAFLAIILASAPIQAMSDPRMWHYVTAHLGWIPLIATGIAVVVFGGLRKYARMRVAL